MLNHSGLGEEMRGFVSGLRDKDRVVSARVYDVSHTYVDSLSEPRRRALQASLAEPEHEHAIHVFHGPVGSVRRTPGAVYQIARTMFETDSLPSACVPHLNEMDEIWVASSFNAATFRRAGVTVPVHVVPSGVDPHVYRPGLTPPPVEGRNGTVFLSVFGWADRKGWDVLLDAWARAFDHDDDVTLVLRTYVADDFDGRHPAAEVERRIDTHLRRRGTSRRRVAPIVVLADHVTDDEMPQLFATADVFVLPTRGEGWGRPLLEAMSCGVPVIATRWGSQLDFLNDDNSFLIDIDGLERIGPAEQVAAFHGQQWARPSVRHLAQLLSETAADPQKVARRGARAREDVLRAWSWRAACETADRLLERAHDSLRHTRRVAPSAPAVRWVGDQWTVHSLAIVNQELCSRLAVSGLVDLETESYEQRCPVGDAPALRALAATAGPVLSRPAQVEVRHQWPPVWTPPREGAWVVMQPWEFGGLPDSWLPALRDQVDEVWCYTSYVRDVYVRSGVPADRVKVIPLGVDAGRFRPDGPRYPLQTSKQFKILFVGGAIPRKGIDVLLDAYVSTFGPADDVCLVVKTAGANSFYRGQAQDRAVRELAADPAIADIELIEDELTADEVAALYRSCDLLVHPYRGEGFGLPVAEAMASGLPVVVTDRGACSDFCDDGNAYLIPSTVVPIGAGDDTGPSTAGYSWAEPDVRALASTLRTVVDDPSEARRRAERARERIAADFSWERSVSEMAIRCRELAGLEPRRTRERSLRVDDDQPASVSGGPAAAAAERDRAAVLYGGGDILGAARVLTELSRRFPDDPGVLSDLGVVAFDLNEPADALSLFDTALRIDPGHADAATNHAELIDHLVAGDQTREVAQQHLRACTWPPRGTRAPLRLNVGAGDDRREGYLSVDLREDTADVVADVRSLPFPDGAVDEVLAFDVLEHFWRDQTASILAEWKRVLRLGGLLQIKVPNLTMLAQHLDGPYHDSIVENIYGGHRWGPDGAYDTHHWGWTPRTVKRELESAGFDVVHNDEQLNMTVRALRR